MLRMQFSSTMLASSVQQSRQMSSVWKSSNSKRCGWVQTGRFETFWAVRFFVSQFCAKTFHDSYLDGLIQLSLDVMRTAINIKHSIWSSISRENSKWFLLVNNWNRFCGWIFFNWKFDLIFLWQQPMELFRNTTSLTTSRQESRWECTTRMIRLQRSLVHHSKWHWSRSGRSICQRRIQFSSVMMVVSKIFSKKFTKSNFVVFHKVNHEMN